MSPVCDLSTLYITMIRSHKVPYPNLRENQNSIFIMLAMWHQFVQAEMSQLLDGLPPNKLGQDTVMKHYTW